MLPCSQHWDIDRGYKTMAKGCQTMARRCHAIAGGCQATATQMSQLSSPPTCVRTPLLRQILPSGPGGVPLLSQGERETRIGTDP